jgi:V8-like Glu-specific endopeptidase
VEERLAWSDGRGLRGAFIALAMLAIPLSLAGSLGCAVARSRAATPAARPEAEGRPVQLSMPFEGASPRDAVVRLVAKGNVTCTGTLIADDRVLTAHHCVSARDAKGRVQQRDIAPEDIQIEIGREDFPWAEVKVRAIVAPQCGYVDGDGDVAILVLERHLIGMPTALARIDAPPKLNDALHIHGYGRCALPNFSCTRKDDKSDGDKAERTEKSDKKRYSTELCTEAIHLRSRESDNVDSVSAGHFSANAEICPGDSGGPVYGSSEELIGVVSAAVMDGLETTRAHSVFTRLDVWAPLFSAAQEISNGASASELPPYGECHAAPPPVRALPARPR